MYQEIKKSILKELNRVLEKDLSLDSIKESEQGDFTTPLGFKLAKKQKRNPGEITAELKEKIDLKNLRYVQKVEAASGFLNFYLDYEKLAPFLLEKVDESYGSHGKKEEKVILEHTSINPSGPVHVGRLRNTLIGDSLFRILSFYGYPVETHYYVNDIGKQIAMIAQAREEDIDLDEETLAKYEKYRSKDDFRIFFQYVSANRKFENDPDFRKRVQELIQRAESGDKKALKKIRDAAEECLSGQRELYSRLGINFDVYDYESSFIENGDVFSVINKLAEQEEAKETEKGLVFDLSSYGLERREGGLVLKREDGTSVYLSRDIAYHLHKLELGDILINVLGEDHRREFKELETLLRNYFQARKKMEAVHFSFVNFQGLQLSTRKGQTAPVDVLLDQAVEKAREVIQEKGIASLDKAGTIGIGAIKYHILRTSPNKQIDFDWSSALDFNGQASPYIQYAYTRCHSILEKTDSEPEKSPEIGGLDPEERQIVWHLLRFPIVIRDSAQKRRPDVLAEYLFELAQEFSRFYKQCPVLGEKEEIEKRRLLLVDSTGKILSTGLNLLGIDAPERM